LCGRQKCANSFEPHQNNSSPAGTPAGIYLPEYIPIADRDGSTLVIDTRDGELHGCVSEYAGEGADDPGPLWRSVSAMVGLCEL
jgi:hypothetical protein